MRSLSLTVRLMPSCWEPSRNVVSYISSSTWVSRLAIRKPSAVQRVVDTDLDRSVSSR